MLDEDTIKKEVKRPLSEDEIRSAVKKLGSKVKIISYLDLEKYKNVSSLFGNYKYVVLLYTADEASVGHWVLLIRHPKNVIEVFDSYAFRPDNILKFFKKNGKEMYPYLSSLLLRSGIKDIIFSNTRLQRMNKLSGVCGRWAIVRILYDLNKKSLADMIRDVKKNKHFSKGHYDGWVVLMTMDLIKEKPSDLQGASVKQAYQKYMNSYRKNFCGMKSRPLELGELHYGCHNFSGPGTVLNYATRNFPPYNNIDKCSKIHDLDYERIGKSRMNREEKALAVRKADDDAINCYDRHKNEDGYFASRLGISGKLTAEKLLSQIKGKPSIFYGAGKKKRIKK